LDTGLGVGSVLIRDNGALLFDDLKAGTIDALIFDSPYVYWRVSQDRSVRVVGEPLNRLGYHVGVRREDTALLVRINAAIQTLRDSDEWRQIRRRWESGP
jgi:putative glutamine transport system substrate-binding protein